MKQSLMCWVLVLVWVSCSLSFPTAGARCTEETRNKMMSPALYEFSSDSAGIDEASLLDYTPQVVTGFVHPNNYEPRRRTSFLPILVIHETALSANTCQQKFCDPRAKVSAHALIARDGTIYTLAPADHAAYGAGVSMFKGEATWNAYKQPTVNHFAYQVELESPEDGYWCLEPEEGGDATRCIAPPQGRGRDKSHSGYTDAQYQSLAWLAVKSGIEPERMTTHCEVDRNGDRLDPRSFSWPTFWQYYYRLSDRRKTITLGMENEAPANNLQNEQDILNTPSLEPAMDTETVDELK